MLPGSPFHRNQGGLAFELLHLISPVLKPPGVRLVVASDFNLKCRGESEIKVS